MNGVTLAPVPEIFEIEGGTSSGFSFTWGVLDGTNNPWVESLIFGALYLHPSSTVDGYWTWTQQLGWIYSSVSNFPQVYSYGKGGYIFLDLTAPTVIKYWDFRQRRWFSEEKIGFENFKVYGSVPNELVGLGSVEVGVGFTNSVFIGHYYLSLSNSSRGGGSSTRVYFYNDSDGWFYPMIGYGGLDTERMDYSLVLTDWRKVRVSRVENDLVFVWADRIWGSGEEEIVYPITNE